MRDIQLGYELVERFLDHRMNVEENSPTTIASYRRTLFKLSNWLDGANLTDITYNDLDDFVNRPVRAGDGTTATKRPASNTSRRQLMTIKAFWRWLIDVEEIPVSKDSKRIRRKKAQIPDGVPTPVDDATWNLVWDSDLDPDDRIWLGMAYFCGFRRFELLWIAPEEVLVDERVFDFLRKGKRTSARKRHRLPYGEIIEEHLRPRMHTIGMHRIDEWLELVEWLATSRRGEKFLSPLTVGEEVALDRNTTVWMPVERDNGRINRRLEQLLVGVGLERNAFRPHDLRDSAATNLYRAGTDLLRMAWLMNHDKLDTTRGYAQVSAVYEAERSRNLHGKQGDEWAKQGDDSR